MQNQSKGGVRGGQDQFKWEDVKLMSYKDRECYLGASSKLGFLDKGGKWRRRDWYNKTGEIEETSKIDEEKARLKVEEKALMNFKLGIKDEFNEGCTEIKQVLEKIRSQATQTKPCNLSTVEIKELTRKGGTSERDIFFEQTPVDRVQGIGMTSQHLMLHTQPNDQPLNKLQGEGELPSAKHEEAQKRLTMINYLTEKIKRQKEVMKEAKEAKKEKKHKKHHRRHDSSESVERRPRDRRRSRSR